MDTWPDESLKPPVPYVKGWRITAASHIPPPPTRVTRHCFVNDKASKLEYRELDPVDRCLRHPPLPGSSGSSSIDLEIYDTLRVGHEHNSQVFIVDILRSDPPLRDLGEGQRVVAKVYDPLYYDDDEGYLNPFRCVDADYTHEAAAYEFLPDLQGKKIPKYYGSFSLEIPVGISATRSVRLLLIEFIPGTTLRDLDPKNVSRSDRQRIMKSVVDFDTSLYKKDIVLQDSHPRNFILVDRAQSDRQEIVVFIDFGDVLFGRTSFYSTDPDVERKSFPGTYISPLLRWHTCHRRASKFRDWIDWNWQRWLEEVYERDAKSITQEMRDRYLPDFLLKRRSPYPEDN